MELRHFRYFLAVAERENVTRAAEDLHMAQQALSAAIKQLETELGYDLFARIAGRIRLTAAGAAFAQDVREILSATDRAVERGRRAAHGELGLVRVAYCSAAMANILPQAIISARGRYPELVVELRRRDKQRQLAALAHGELDLALTYRPFDARGLIVHDIWSERIVAAVPLNHPLADAAAIEPRALNDAPLVRFARDSFDILRATTDELFLGAAITPHYVAELADVETALGFVGAGIGIALLNEQIVRMQHHPGIRFIPVVSDLRLRLAAVWNENTVRASIVRRFVEIVEAEIPQAGCVEASESDVGRAAVTAVG